MRQTETKDVDSVESIRNCHQQAASSSTAQNLRNIVHLVAELHISGAQAVAGALINSCYSFIQTGTSCLQEEYMTRNVFFSTYNHYTILLMHVDDLLLRSKRKLCPKKKGSRDHVNSIHVIL